MNVFIRPIVKIFSFGERWNFPCSDLDGYFKKKPFRRLSVVFFTSFIEKGAIIRRNKIYRFCTNVKAAWHALCFQHINSIIYHGSCGLQPDCFATILNVLLFRKFIQYYIGVQKQAVMAPYIWQKSNISKLQIWTPNLQIFAKTLIHEQVNFSESLET